LVKAHYKLDYPDDLVGLHHLLEDIGISKIENNLVNICYLSNYDNFKQFKSLTDYQNCVLSQNSHLKEIFDRAALQLKSH
jgi:hypothetical protein